MPAMQRSGAVQSPHEPPHPSFPQFIPPQLGVQTQPPPWHVSLAAQLPQEPPQPSAPHPMIDAHWPTHGVGGGGGGGGEGFGGGGGGVSTDCIGMQAPSRHVPPEQLVPFFLAWHFAR